MANDKELNEARLDAAIEDIKKAVATTGKIPEGVIQSAEQLGDTPQAMEFDPDPTQRATTVVYDTVKGIPSRVLDSNLRNIMRKRWPATSLVPKSHWGKRVFSLEPVIIERPAQLKCMLNPSYEDRELIVDAGLGDRTCLKSNMPTETDRTLHMQKRHPSEWRAIESHITRVRELEREEREIQNMKTLQALVEKLTEVPSAKVEE